MERRIESNNGMKCSQKLCSVDGNQFTMHTRLFMYSIPTACRNCKLKIKQINEKNENM